MKNDLDIVLVAVQQDGCSLESACSAFRSDRRIVLAALFQNFQAWPFVGPQLRQSQIVLYRMRMSFKSALRRDLPPVVMLLIFEFLFGAESPSLSAL